MFEKLNFAIYTIFNFCYRDGNHRKNDSPHFNAVMLLTLFEFFFLALVFFIASLIRFLIYGPLPMISIPFDSGYIWGAIIMILTYLLFVKSGKLDKLYGQYAHHCKEREKKYRKYLIGIYCILPMLASVLCGHIGAWFSTSDGLLLIDRVRLPTP